MKMVKIHHYEDFPYIFYVEAFKPQAFQVNKLTNLWLKQDKFCTYTCHYSHNSFFALQSQPSLYSQREHSLYR